MVPGRGAVRPQHQWHQLVHADGLQRLAVGQPAADRPMAATRRSSGELHDAYAVTEAEAGSDPSGISTTAVTATTTAAT